MLHGLVERARNARGVAIAGPTASGKSGLALALAGELGGTVVNADSMQVYRDLRVLTARPSAADEARVPHRLYGVVDGATAFSAAAWAEAAAVEIAQARGEGRLPVLVGGTGLYWRTLFEGIAAVPAIPEAVRSRWREAARAAAPGTLHAALARRDPAMAARLAPGDTQRLVRALEVVDATGRSLADWQMDAGAPFEPAGGWLRIAIVPTASGSERPIAVRAAAMLAAGGLDEVAALLARRLDPALPVMRAIGVAEAAAALRGEASVAAAAAALAAATRRYAKRQRTWLRTQLPGWERQAPIEHAPLSGEAGK